DPNPAPPDSLRALLRLGSRLALRVGDAVRTAFAGDALFERVPAVDGPVDRSALGQLRVRSLLDEPPAIEGQDPVRALQGRRAGRRAGPSGRGTGGSRVLVPDPTVPTAATIPPGRNWKEIPSIARRIAGAPFPVPSPSALPAVAALPPLAYA